MHILMISTDTNAHVPTSRVAGRLRAIESRAGALTVLVYDRRRGIAGLVALIYEGLRVRAKVDVVTSQDPFVFGLVGVVLSLWHRAPLNVQIHTDATSRAFIYSSLRHFISYILMQFVVRCAHSVRVVSKRTATALQSSTSARISVLPISVDSSTFQTPRERPLEFGDGPVILAVSRLTKEKRIEITIRSLALILDAHLYIVGDGPLRGVLHKESVQHGVEGRVHFVGHTNDVVPYFQHADCFVHTASYEGYGMVLIESLMAGTPVVTTDVGVARELPREYVQVVAPTPEAVAAAVLSTLSHPPEVVYDKRGDSEAEYAEKFIATLL